MKLLGPLVDELLSISEQVVEGEELVADLLQSILRRLELGSGALASSLGILMWRSVRSEGSCGSAKARTYLAISLQAIECVGCVRRLR